MPEKLVWTEGMDTRLRRLRTEGASYDIIALVLGVTRAAVADRAARFGPDRMPVRDLDQTDRLPLPAGHPQSWGAITAGTVLQDMPFHASDAIR